MRSSSLPGDGRLGNIDKGQSFCCQQCISKPNADLFFNSLEAAWDSVNPRRPAESLPGALGGRWGRVGTD